MVLELHVWGPAFGLPSLDAQCLATVAYMRNAVPRGQWSLVACCDPTLCPTNELPALRNGHDWVSGYRNILNYISQNSKGKWNLDAGLREQEAADCTAYSTFIEVHGQHLIDLSLYVSSQNYSEVTRPIYNTIQPFPLPYLTPPHLRTVAKERTKHLGLSTLDIDTEDNDNARESSIIPESIRIGRQTVSSLLATSPETHAQIRLVALAKQFFEPLQELKGKKKYLVSNSQISSLDCLALGFISLMLYPKLPQSWLAKTLRNYFPDLCRWVEELKVDALGGVVNASDAMLTKAVPNTNATVAPRPTPKNDLPWQAPENNGVLSVSGVFLGNLADAIPVVGRVRKDIRMRRDGGKLLQKQQLDESDDSGFPVWRYVTIAGSVVAAMGVLAGYAFHQGLIAMPDGWQNDDEGNRTQGVSDLGEAGEAMFAFADQIEIEKERQRQIEREVKGPIVQVGIE